MLLSLAPIVMQTVLVPNFLDFFFLPDILLFDANERICFFLRNFLLLYKLKNKDDLNSASY